jgi:ATP-dependent RNA helicase RhlE
MEQLLIFTRTKLAASRLASYLDRRGVAAVAIHSDRSQPERTRALEDFKRGEVTCLVATDVASRGLDIEELPYVVNFELPFEAQDYIHRIGRTGRAGLSGVAISLVCTDEVDLLKGVQRLLKKSIPYQVVEGFVPDRTIEPRPIRGFGRDGSAGGDRSHHAHHKPIRTRTGSGGGG